MAIVVERPIPLGLGSYNGIGWGSGLAIQVIDCDVEETPDLRTNDQIRTGAHGTWTGNDFYGGRTVTLALAVLGTSNDDLRTQLASIETAWLPDSIERPLWLYNSTRFLKARIRKRRFSHALGGLERVTTVTLQFYARDPFLYGPQQNITVGPGVVAGGLAWPLTWPLAWGSVVSGGAVITNPGPVETAPIIQIPGPCTNPSVTNDTLAATLRVATTLNVGDTLVLDTDARTVTLLNGPSRDSSLDPTSRWWRLQPGVNFIRFSSGSGVSTEYASLLYSPAWP